MLYKDDWDKAQLKFEEYWVKENHDRPLIRLMAPKSETKSSNIIVPGDNRDCWMDTGYVIKKAREKMENTYFAGESFPIAWPNLGPDIFGATFGTDIIFEERTSYATKLIEDWDDFPELKFDENNAWWKKILEMTEAMVENSKGDYIVGITDLHPGADGLVSLRGPEDLCIDLYDDPDRIKKAIYEMHEPFKYQLKTLFDKTQKYQKGTTNWLEVWKSDMWYVTSCDFIALLSKEMFREFILPELAEQFRFLPGRNIFHLDGPDALKHLDDLLEIPEIAGIEWVYGAGQPSAAHWIPELKKIQNAGKLIHIEVEFSDIVPLTEALKPEGVMYWCMEDAKDEDQAKAIIKQLESAYKKKYY